MAALAGIAGLAGCGAGGHTQAAAAVRPGGAATVGGGAAGQPATTRPAPTTVASTVPATTTTTLPPAADPGWTAVVTTPRGVSVEERTVVTGGASVTLARFRAGTYRLDLHTGSQDPGGTAAVPADGSSMVSAAERPLLVGAFNGGFKVATGSGGVEVDGHVLAPLQAGKASVVIDAAGAARVGVYGQDVPVPGDPAVSVRQNLGLLVAGGAPAPTIGNVLSWGATVGGRLSVARSALGQTPSGDLIFGASMSCLPAALAAAMIQGGAVTAMQLDINPTWVQLDLAPAPGATLAAAVPGQWRPSAQLLDGWTRDFFAVLSR